MESFRIVFKKKQRQAALLVAGYLFAGIWGYMVFGIAGVVFFASIACFAFRSLDP